MAANPWKEVKMTVRNACELKFVGKETEATQLLQSQLPIKIGAWAKTSRLDAQGKKERIKDLFDEELERTEDIARLTQVVTEQVEDRLVRHFTARLLDLQDVLTGKKPLPEVKPFKPELPPLPEAKVTPPTPAPSTEAESGESSEETIPSAPEELIEESETPTSIDEEAATIDQVLPQEDDLIEDSAEEVPSKPVQPKKTVYKEKSIFRPEGIRFEDLENIIDAVLRGES